jgi:vitamin B12 transporter
VGENATVWNLSGQYDFASDWFVKTTLGTNFRLPSAEELFANDPQDERGNPNLRPERSKSLNLSIGSTLPQTSGRYSWELIGFAREIKDLIDYDLFDEDTGQYVFNNVPGKVRVRGAELVVGADLAAGTSAHLSFVRNRSHAGDGVQLSRVPESLLKANLDYAPASRPFGASLSLNYTGNVAAPVGGNRVSYGNYAVVNFSARYFLGESRQQRINLGLQNAFDREYGRPSRGCDDVSTDGPYDCSSPYVFVNRGLPRTATLSYRYEL